jgi:hypothetical protein
MDSEEAVYTSFSHIPAVVSLGGRAGSYYFNEAWDKIPQPPPAKWICCSGAV